MMGIISMKGISTSSLIFHDLWFFTECWSEKNVLVIPEKLYHRCKCFCFLVSLVMKCCWNVSHVQLLILVCIMLYCSHWLSYIKFSYYFITVIFQCLFIVCPFISGALAALYILNTSFIVLFPCYCHHQWLKNSSFTQLSSDNPLSSYFLLQTAIASYFYS